LREILGRRTGCGQLYWPGSHFGKLQTRIEQIRERFSRMKPTLLFVAAVTFSAGA